MAVSGTVHLQRRRRLPEHNQRKPMMRTSNSVLRSTFACLAVATGIIAVAAPASARIVGEPEIDGPGARTAAMAVVPACVDFLPVADNTVLGNTFVRSAYKFQALGGLVATVNVTTDLLGNDVHGAQFNNTGLRIATPTPADTVEVTMGVFHPPFVTVRAFDAAGALVDSATVPADNVEHTVTVDGAQDITRLRFTGGGNEAIVKEVCVP